MRTKLFQTDDEILKYNDRKNKYLVEKLEKERREAMDKIEAEKLKEQGK